LQRTVYQHSDYEADALSNLQSVKADRGGGAVGSPTNIEDDTNSSILDRLQARNEDIPESEQDAVAVIKPRKD
jgi:hypothetical protein